MLTRFEVKGFKSLVDVAVDLGAVNVFIGANGSGKSNLLEAIGFVGAASSGQINAESLRYRGIRLANSRSYCSANSTHVAANLTFNTSDEKNKYRLILRPEGLYNWIFAHEIISYDDKLVATGSDGTASVRAGSTFTNFRRGEEASSFSITQLLRFYFVANKDQAGEQEAYDPVPKLVSNYYANLRNYLIFTPSTPQLRGFLDDIKHDPLGLGGSDLGRVIEELLSSNPEKLGPFEMDEVLDLIDWADDIRTTARDYGATSAIPIRLQIGDRFMENGNKTVSAVEASEGALYVLFLLALVGRERSPKMFAVDNFDQALHPRLARELTKIVCDQIIADGTRQMFATTHNPLVLDGLDLLDDRIRLFAVDRDATGATKVQRVMVTKELIDQSNAGLSLSRLWTMGRFGGVPHNI